MTLKQTIIERLSLLPTLPASVAQLARLIASPDTSAVDFERVIKPDPSLTTNLLRLANSAYFGIRREVSSVRQAIALLGTKRVFELAASAAFSQVLPKRIHGYNLDASDFWIHCIAVAVFSEKLAKELRLPEPQMLFTSGLLHDIGKLAVGDYVREHADEIDIQMELEHLAFAKAELAILKTDHSEIGEALATIWDLPEAVMWSALWHHKPSSIEDATVDSTLVDLVHVADVCAHMFGYGADTGELRRELCDVSVQRLGLNIDVLENIAAACQTDIDEMGEVFR